MPEPIGFTTPQGERFVLVASHHSAVREGGQPKVHADCEGCGTKRKTNA